MQGTFQNNSESGLGNVPPAKSTKPARWKSSAADQDTISLEHINLSHLRPKATLSTVSRWWTQWFTDWWMFEFFALAWSIAFLLAIVAILYVYDQKASASWPLGITVNTTVSILCTVSKLGIVEVAGAALGQLRWNWLSRDRMLTDVTAFDNASRGSPWAGFRLILRLGAVHLGSLGASLSILLLAFSSITQQAIDFPSRLVVVGNASMPRSLRLPQRNDGAFIVNTTDYRFMSPTDTNMLAAVSYAAYNGSRLDPGFALEPVCSSGNCRYGKYASIAICTDCTDISNDVSASCGSGNCTYLVQWLNPLTGVNSTLLSGYSPQSGSEATFYTSLNISALPGDPAKIELLNLTALSTAYKTIQSTA